MYWPDRVDAGGIMDQVVSGASDRLAVPLPNGFTPERIGSTISSKIQELILLPTEKCNLRCTYCYEDFKIGKMSEETQVGVERFLDRRVSDLTQLRFNWFGGEPLVAKDVVLRLSQYAKRLCDERGVAFLGGLTTNAYLLDRALLEELVACKQDFFQVTLDGWGETHDAVRRFANGRGSFDRIWINLLGMQASAVRFDTLLRIHVRRQNLGELPELMERLGDVFAGDDRFRLDFEHLRDLGGPGGATVNDPVGPDEMRQIEASMRAIYQSRRPTDLDAAEADRSATVADEALRAAKAMGESAGAQRREDLIAGGPYICYASKANSLLIRANGRIGKCTVALNDDRNDIGRLNPDGTVTIDNDKLRPWLRGLEDLDPATLGCPLATLPRTQSARQAAVA